MYVFLGQVLKSTFIVWLNFILFNFLLFLELERILKEKLDNEIPVITVVSVMGTTEESAVDPLTEILELRKQFRTKVCHVSTPLQYLMGPLQFTITWYKNRHAGEQTAHWDL